LDRAGELVRKEQIIAALWPETPVAANTLNVHIRRLRITLRDAKRPQRLLKASSRIGFMIMASPTSGRIRMMPKSQRPLGDKSRFIRDVTARRHNPVTGRTIRESMGDSECRWRNRSLRRVASLHRAGAIKQRSVIAYCRHPAERSAFDSPSIDGPQRARLLLRGLEMVDDQGREMITMQSPLFVSIDVLDDRC
jgi:hypothetical protein